MSKNNPYGAKSHLGGIDFETVRQFIQCDINLHQGKNIGCDNDISDSESRFLYSRGLNPYNMDTINEYVRLRSLVLYDINRKKTPVDKVTKEFKEDRDKIGRFSIIDDRFNGQWLIYGLRGIPIIQPHEYVPYSKCIERHQKALDILTGTEYNMLSRCDPLDLNKEDIMKYLRIIKKLIKSGMFEDDEPVELNTNSVETEENESEVSNVIDKIFDGIDKLEDPKSSIKHLLDGMALGAQAAKEANSFKLPDLDANTEDKDCDDYFID